MKHRASLETHYKHLCMYCQLYSYIDVVDADSANDANVINNNVYFVVMLTASVQINVSLTSVKDVLPISDDVSH